jgi:hypothetical protein
MPAKTLQPEHPETGIACGRVMQAGGDMFFTGLPLRMAAP